MHWENKGAASCRRISVSETQARGRSSFGSWAGLRAGNMACQAWCSQPVHHDRNSSGQKALALDTRCNETGIWHLLCLKLLQALNKGCWMVLLPRNSCFTQIANFLDSINLSDKTSCCSYEKRKASLLADIFTSHGLFCFNIVFRRLDRVFSDFLPFQACSYIPL